MSCCDQVLFIVTDGWQPGSGDMVDIPAAVGRLKDQEVAIYGVGVDLLPEAAVDLAFISISIMDISQFGEVRGNTLARCRNCVVQ